MSLLSELKRRRVLRATGLYLVVAWAVIQVADVVMPRLGMPGWTVSFIIVVAALGLPIAIVLAWLYDFTGNGVARTAGADVRPPSQLGSASRATGLIGLGMVVVLVVFGAYWRLQPHEKRDNADTNSVAVLPFVDMSPGKDQEYFGDGITEEILNVLAQVPGLRVPARTSSFSFKGKNLPIEEIARQLKVANVLEGSIRKSGDQVRITAQLIDASNDKHLWSETYDRKLSDVFAVQDEIAHAIVDALRLHIAQSSPLVDKETSSPAAHEAYLKGLYYWHRRHNDELPLALDEFKAAVRADPNYARAYAGIALTYAVLRQYVPDTDREVAIREGQAAAAQALKLDARAADAHAALSQIAQTMEWDWKSAEAHADSAVALDPKYATAHQWRAEVYGLTGRYADALRESNRALELDPLSSVIQNERAWALQGAGRTDEAQAAMRSIVDRDPSFMPARESLLTIALWKRDYDAALKLAGTDSNVLMIIAALKDPAKVPGMLVLLGEAKTRANAPRATLAKAYMLLDQKDSAAALLDRAADAREPLIENLAGDPIFQPLHAHPRFQAYRRKLHLPE